MNVSVKTWAGKDVMLSDSTQVIICETIGESPMVGINLNAEDGTVFAHAHFDVATAKDVVADLQDYIAKAEKRN